MKIAFDEHIPTGLVQVFEGLAKHGLIPNVTVVSARSYKPPKERGDVGWIGRFAQNGGRVIISGDRNMRSNVHERVALAEAGMIIFFFQAAWSNRNSFVKSAMLLNWWPKIQEYLENSKPGDC